MSQQKKLEQILNLLVNEEMEQAEDLLHELVIEKARYIYEELVNDEDEDEEEMEESIGGDMKQGFTDEVSDAEDDIETDELQDGEVEVGDEFGDEEMSTEEKVEDLEAQLEELRAEFEQLMSDELEEPYHDADDFAGDYSDEGDLEMELGSDEGEFRLGEATNFSSDVSVDMGTEGKLVGAGKTAGATGTKSPYSNAPKKYVDGPSPVNFTKGNDKAGGATPSSKDETPSDNIDAPQKNVADTAQAGNGGYVGTGKGTPKGAENDKSPLSKAPGK